MSQISWCHRCVHLWWEIKADVRYLTVGNHDHHYDHEWFQVEYSAFEPRWRLPCLTHSFNVSTSVSCIWVYLPLCICLHVFLYFSTISIFLKIAFTRWPQPCLCWSTQSPSVTTRMTLPPWKTCSKVSWLRRGTTTGGLPLDISPATLRATTGTFRVKK